MTHEVLLQNILSPFTLFFALGILAAIVKSDLKFPDAIGSAMGIFLLASIGLRAGVSVSKTGLNLTIIASAAAAIGVGALLAYLSYSFLRSRLISLDPSNAGSLAGHIGAVSSGTVVMTISFLEQIQVPYEAFIPALYPFMDTAALILAILLARKDLGKQEKPNGNNHESLKMVLIETLTAKTTVLLLGGLAIGYLSGEAGTTKVMPLFDTMFHGVTALFMLDIGILAGSRLSELKNVSKLILGYGMVIPFVNSFIGAVTATLLGLSPGGITVFAVGLAGCASFISAPIVMRTALPKANPSLSLGLSLLVIFPINIIIGIPVAYQLALFLHGF